MSQLMSEEREFVENARCFPQDVGDVDGLIAIIDRLSARCEELSERNKNFAEVYEELENLFDKKKQNLSSLLSAVEPIVKELKYFEKNIHVYPENTTATLPLPIPVLRTLSTVTAGIREGE